VRSISLSKGGVNKIRSHLYELKSADFETPVKSFPPGEWIVVTASGSDQWVGYINPMIEDKYTCAYVVGKISSSNGFSIENFIKEKIASAYERRCFVQGYGINSRVFYGASDGLPGLIIDHFENAAIIQINTAGIDRYRDFIKVTLEEITGTKAYFLDNPKYREKEFLPEFSTDPLPELDVLENGLKYKIRKEVLQKVGFYYDHRENRLQLMNFLQRMKNPPKKGMDLFCYAGAWGMNALKAGAQEMYFIDQGDFEIEVKTALEMNGFSSKGKFVRSDVFKFLDEAIKTNQTFDLILCDPPAFAKTALQKSQALEGYSKLHRKVFKLLEPKSFVAFSSCTHYVSHEEFQKNVADAANKENRKIQMVYTGIQGLDHPIVSLQDKASYIKSYFYLVE
jgi:23S rRNA (cytosine1962-C5)-methyltransferase